MTHEMKLDPKPFESIASGKKTIELRLYDEKRQKIAVGDTVIFSNRTVGETIRVKVLALHRFPSFKELYDTLPLEKCGYCKSEITADSYKDMLKYYKESDQLLYGVVGIEFEKVK